MDSRKITEYSFFYQQLGTYWFTRGGVKLEIYYLQGNPELEIFFEPRKDYCTPEELKKMQNCNSSHEYEMIYQELSYLATKLFAGAFFGLKYAYDVYLREATQPHKVRALIHSVLNRHGATHDVSAYAAAKALWTLLEFTPGGKSDIYFEEHKRKFVFPDATAPIPIGDLAKSEIHKFLKQGNTQYTQEDVKELSDHLEETHLEYHTR